MDTTTLAIIIALGILVLANVILLVWMFQTEKRFKRFFQGKKAADLEDALTTLIARADALEKRSAAQETTLDNHDERIKRSVRSIPLSRFNPFPDVGGNQSFAMSLIDEEGNGVVVSSLYARDRMSVFAKGIRGGKSEQELSTEEKAILEKNK